MFFCHYIQLKERKNDEERKNEGEEEKLLFSLCLAWRMKKKGEKRD